VWNIAERLEKKKHRGVERTRQWQKKTLFSTSLPPPAQNPLDWEKVWERDKARERATNLPKNIEQKIEALHKSYLSGSSAAILLFFNLPPSLYCILDQSAPHHFLKFAPMPKLLESSEVVKLPLHIPYQRENSLKVWNRLQFPRDFLSSRKGVFWGRKIGRRRRPRLSCQIPYPQNCLTVLTYTTFGNIWCVFWERGRCKIYSYRGYI
jgi:hypothetical protein